MGIVASPTSASVNGATDLPEQVETAAGLVPSHGIHVDKQLAGAEDRPPLLKHVSTPAYNSPLRHHRRNISSPRQVKESLNARSEYLTSGDDGVAEHRINQYIIKQEIGRGSFGAVHLAVDQYGMEFAAKEFSKARLRKRAQSHILRTPLSQRKPGALAARQGFNSPLHRNVGDSQDQKQNAIELIKEEIAIMKKLNHQNLVSLIEVLDDPSEDSLYMVMEMCKKGVVMKVGLGERADPYPDEMCRCWFRDLILGIEYLHAQGVVHRDIKPDNCLITEDDVLKVVDFGVSEMFQKDSEMVTAKSAGSPAFLPPELCVVKHGDVSGKAADIWSMGVTLYCLKYGHIPFEKTGIFELYDAIKADRPPLDNEENKDFRDLILRILEKDATKRIKMTDLRKHPWVTKRGADPLLSEEENTSDLVGPVTEAEMRAAITGNMRNLMTVVKAVKKFKSLIAAKRPTTMTSILGEHDDGRFSQPPTAIQSDKVPLPHLEHRSHSMENFDRGRPEGALVADGIHRDIVPPQLDLAPEPQERGNAMAHDADQGSSDTPILSHAPSTESGDMSQATSDNDALGPLPNSFPRFRAHRGPRARTADEAGHRGQAHNPLEDHLYLFIGPSTFAAPSVNPDRRPSFVPDSDDVPIVSESPGAADFDVYETAYRDEIERLKAKAEEEDTEEPNVYLTRRVEGKLFTISSKAGSVAGRVAAAGEERFRRFQNYAQLRERKAKVTEVSRALREVARDEYTRRKQERKDQYETAKSERAQRGTESTETAETGEEPAPSHTEMPSSPAPLATDNGPQPPDVQKSPGSPSQWTDRAADKGRQARTSLMGFVDMVKTKSRSGRGSRSEE